MPKLPILSSKDVIRVLKHLGFVPAPKRGKGSHFAFVKKKE
jgi:predicted RNA binding protein YcfA (HicA-like mRNA interferase family)